MAGRLSAFSRAISLPSGAVRSRGILYPLDTAYAHAGVPAPIAREVEPKTVPLPYRSLLVHDRPMTSTLEQHYGGRVALRALATFTRGRAYFRRVLLVQESSGRPVAMGAIRVLLDALNQRARAEIVRAATPFGRVLRDAHVNYISRPRAFMAVTPNSEMMGVFWMRESRALYGRQTEIFLQGKKIGDIVEILPPA